MYINYVNLICNRIFWTWTWMTIPCSWRSLNSKSQGRDGWTVQLPSSLPLPPLPLWATTWAPSTLTMKTTPAISGRQTSGARPPSPNQNNLPSDQIAPWVWRSPAVACTRLLGVWKTWNHFLWARWLLRQASLPPLPSQLRSNQLCLLTVTRLSCAVASRKQAAASMALSASLPMVRQSYVDYTATPSTRQSPAEPSTILATAPMARVATSFTRRKAAAHWHLPNSKISGTQLPPVVRIHATSSARVSALPGSWAHAVHLLHLSIHPSMILTWGSAVLPLFLHPRLISSPQCLSTPCSGMQQRSSLATIRPEPALETSTTFL